jgi:hypothetical protein
MTLPTLLLPLLFLSLTQPDAVAPPQPLPDQPTVDQVLDALSARGRSLRSLSADVALGRTDESTGRDTVQTGKVWLRVDPEGSDTRVRVRFEKRKSGPKTYDEPEEFLLAGETLVNRVYKSKTENRRQVRKPGEKVNLFSLGEGPFPLPIGQDPARVKKEFQVDVLPADDGAPANTVHARLVPNPGTRMANKIKSMDLWIDRADHLPRRIVVEQPNDAGTRTTDLTNPTINGNLTDQDLSLPPIDPKDWNMTESKYDE